MAKRLQSRYIILGACLWGVCSAWGAENGLLTYPLGVNTVLNGMMPAPGTTQFYNYTEYYEANKFVGTHGQTLIPDFHVKVLVDALRFIHTWEQPVGPFSLSTGVVIPVAHTSLKTPGGNGSKTGLGDIILQPMLLGYADPSHGFFAYASPLELGVPTGEYSQGRIANIGNNYYAYQPSVSGTWFAAPGWELSATAMVEINSKNKDTQYLSGKTAVVDYVAGYSVKDQWQLGLQGYFLKQFSDDKVNGVVYADGFRARAAGIGPQIRYDFAPGAGIAVKYQREFDVENHPKGNRFWVQFSLPI